MDICLGVKETEVEFSILPMTCTVMFGDSLNFLWLFPYIVFVLRIFFSTRPPLCKINAL